MKRVQTITPSYFGKIPSKDDFMTSAGADHRLVRRLDHWLAECMARLSEHPGWQTAYDASESFDVLAATTHSRNVAAGTCLPSHDAAGRRCPMLACLRVQSRTPMAFAATAPIALGTLWSCLQHDLSQLKTLQDTGSSLQRMGTTPMLINADKRPHDEALREYMSTESAIHLDALLVSAGHATKTSNVLAALHALLNGVAAEPYLPISRGLILPLPADPMRRTRVAAFWMTQLLPYLGKRDIEVVALLTRTPTPRLVISLDGTRGTELMAATMPAWVADAYIDLTCAPSPGELLPNVPQSPHACLQRLSEAFLSHARKPNPCE
ncbi:type VI secretion system-associated protein TagF [Luteibacter sp. 22Crub2.1]|uniref:type VI secretion system-associated protein TagF n=1 Tax=Luteibacter sp. 22Crub2.1 TaxID=1283288 RepID=UPI0009A680FD|nr:type VI secretion system-associated protein TagF [Luteibacter sp. 22Crub2.1]SKB88205.1 type VI secretion system protein ImpM [Luteibacter sp. 22Crub2.1]